MLIKNECPVEDIDKIIKVLDRFEERIIHHDRKETLFDLMNCQSGGCLLDLDKLLESEDIDFFHDLNGIKTYMDRRTGFIGGYFVPRCAKDEAYGGITFHGTQSYIPKESFNQA